MLVIDRETPGHDARSAPRAAGETPRARVLVVLERSKGFQNFVAAGAFDTLAVRHELRFASPPAGDGPIPFDPLDFVEAGRWVPVASETRRTADWNRLALTAQVRLGFSRYRRRLRRLRLLPLCRRERALQTALALPGVRTVYTVWLRQRLLRTRHAGIARLLDEQRPDVVVHPSVLNGPLVNDLLLACRARAIPSIVLMDSWDNPSTKNATLVPPDWLLVWGEQTRRHAVTYMGLPPERVVPLGAPQLEALRLADVAGARAAFRARHGLDADETVLLYAASSILEADFDALAALDEAVAAGQLPACRIVYRPYPDARLHQEQARIRAASWRHVVIEHAAPPPPQNGRLPGIALVTGEAAEKIAAMAGADAMISPLSTILLEAALIGRPVLCYFPESETSRFFRRANAPLVHFDEFLAVPEVVVAEHLRDLVPATRRLLARAAERDIAERLRAACRHFVAPAARPYADRLADFVDVVLRLPRSSEGLAAGRRRAA